MSNMIEAGFFDEYARPLEAQIEGMRRFGISHLELRYVGEKNVSELSTDEVKQIKRALSAGGCSVSAIGSPIGKLRLDGDVEEHLKMASRVFETAARLESKYVRMFSFYAPEGKCIADMRDEVLALLERLVTAARPYGVSLCHENEANIYGDTPKRCLELLTHFGGELQCVFDMGNFVLEGVEPLGAYGLLREHVAYFHIKDALHTGAVVPPGRGEARIGDILAAHRASTDRDFFVSLEPHLHLRKHVRTTVGRAFENPYQYEDAQSAFTDAIIKFRELI